MIEGRFRRFDHDHYFEKADDGTTVMRDVDFASPYGLLGWFVDRLTLRRYLEQLIRDRNRLIKVAAERGRTRGAGTDEKQ